MPSQNVLGIYPSDSVSEVAQSLPLDPLAQGTAEVLAGDVEYRLHLIIQEAKKFMVHGKRATLLPEDVEYAMEALNVEPLLIPPRPLPQQPFVPVTIPAANANANPTQVYHVPDEEIDFATYLKQPLPPGLSNSAGVQWKAHWLAVEGVQPAIPENPTPSSRAGPSRLPIPATGSAALKPSAKSQLPQDLQLYFSRLTSALVPIAPPTGITDAPGLSDMERHRSAAIASLSSDVAVTGLLVYMVKWLSESIQKCLMGPLPVIGYLVDAVEALLQNEHVFLEPYIHQLLGPIMSILLTFPLGPHPPPSSVTKGELTSYGLRVRAAHLLRKVAEVYGPKYPGLLPRLTSTLTKTLNSSPFPSPLGSSYPPAGRYEGAILGLAAVGPHAVRTGIWSNESTPMSRIDDLAVRLYPGSEGKKTKVGLSKAFAKAMAVLCTETTGQSGQTGNGGNVDMDKFGQVFGYNLARIFDKKDNRWIAAEMLRLKGEEESGAGMEVDTPRA